MVGTGMFDGFYRVLVIIGIIIFIIACVPTFIVTKIIYYDKGYKDGIVDYKNGLVKIDTIVTTKINIRK
jgi:hypothetical protein